MGLIYGIPKFIPLNISKLAVIKVAAGRIKLESFLVERLSLTPPNVISKRSGSVPSPNTVMNRAPDRNEPVAADEANAA